VLYAFFYLGCLLNNEISAHNSNMTIDVNEMIPSFCEGHLADELSGVSSE